MRTFTQPLPGLLSAILILLFWGTGCHKAFEFSPYSEDVPSRYEDLNTEFNLGRLQQLSSGRPLKMGLIADPHYSHDELRDAISSINNDSSIAFVIFCGDYSDQGLLQEYLTFYDELKRLNKPFFTVIGNHDHLANAAGIYTQMFGPANYVVDYQFTRFIFFDDCFWERETMPDFDWLEAQLAVAQDRKIVVVAHIPPYGDQFDTESRCRYLDLMEKYRVSLSIHGHTHRYELAQESNTIYLTVPASSKQQYCTVELLPDKNSLIISLFDY